MTNDLPILPRIVLERVCTDPRDGRSDHDVTTALTHDHWATLSRYYSCFPDVFWQEADNITTYRAERLRDKLASMS